MKSIIKTGLGFVLLFAVSCAKESANKTSTIQTEVSSSQTLSFTIGQHYGGGIIFYIDSTGQHGLIADTGDIIISGARWWNPRIDVLLHTRTGATATKIGSGHSNTKKIVATEGDSGQYAARLCFKSTRSGYKDWFLPSKDELNELYLHQDAVGGFVSSAYWSSSEDSTNKTYAWRQLFTKATQKAYYKGSMRYVRAIRAF